VNEGWEVVEVWKPEGPFVGDGLDDLLETVVQREQLNLPRAVKNEVVVLCHTQQEKSEPVYQNSKVPPANRKHHTACMAVNAWARRLWIEQNSLMPWMKTRFASFQHVT